MPSGIEQNKVNNARMTEKLLAALEGNEITIIHTGEKLGNNYSARVLMVEDNHLTVNLPRRIAGAGYLRTSVDVIINFVVDNTMYKAEAEYRANGDEMREVVVRGPIEADSRRHFNRLPLNITTGYVPVSDLSLSSGRLPRINWHKCQAGDISGGGILIQTRSPLQSGAYLLLNLDIESFHGPLFVFGQVRWVGLCGSTGRAYHCGIMFLPYEDLPYHFSPPAISWIPPIMQQFDKEKQDDLNKFLENKSCDIKGEQNDNQ